MLSRPLLLLTGAFALSCSFDLDAVTAPGADLNVPDGSSLDGPVVDQSMVDTAQVDLIKIDAIKPDAAKSDAPLMDAAKADVQQIDAAKADAQQIDAAKTDILKVDAPSVDKALSDGPTPDITGCNNNGTVDPGEQCDGLKFGGETCISQGYDFGDLGCKACKFDFSTCFVHDWKLVSAGAFTSGSTPGDVCYGSLSGNYKSEFLINVNLTRPFLISAKEVTVGQYKALMKASPSANASCGDSCPVENVTWAEAAAYCNALSKAKGLEECYACTGSVGSNMACPEATGFVGKAIYGCAGYRLPSEVEWEKAYRTTSSGGIEYKPIHTLNGKIQNNHCNASAGSTDLAKIGYHKGYATAKMPVGKLDPNGLGLYDMSGNVYEWTQDWFMINRQGAWGTGTLSDPIHHAPTSTYRSLKGGSYKSMPYMCRGSSRFWLAPTGKSEEIGFRCVKQSCVKRAEEGFSGAPLTGWTGSSLIRVDGSAGVTAPVSYNGVYRHTSIDNKQGGHNKLLTKAISLGRFFIQAKMTGDHTKTSPRASVGVHPNTTMGTDSSTKLKHGTGYACNWLPNKGQVTVTRLDGAKGETVVARASGLTASSSDHIISCARKQNGTWVIIVDTYLQTLTVNTKDLTYLKLTHVSLLLSADSTVSALDDVTVRDCN